MSKTYDDIAKQFEQLFSIVLSSKKLSKSIQQYYGSPKSKTYHQSKKTAKSVMSYSPTKKKTSPEKNSRLCPWIEDNKNYSLFQSFQSPKKNKNTKKVAKSFQGFKKPEPLQYNEYSYENETGTETEVLSILTDSEMNSDDEEYFIEELDAILNDHITKKFFRVWKNRFMIRTSILIKRELQNLTLSKQMTQNQEIESENEEEKMDSNDNGPYKRLSALDSEEKENLIDIILSSQE